MDDTVTSGQDAIEVLPIIGNLHLVPGLPAEYVFETGPFEMNTIRLRSDKVKDLY